MRLMHNPERTEPCVLVLGMFDGVHRGHQALFLRARELAARDALPVTVCTFEPHPLAVIRPELSPERLTTPLERAQWMGLCGVDRVCVHDFTREVADREPEAFLEGSNFGFFLRKSSRLRSCLSMCLTLLATFAAPPETLAPAALSSAFALLSAVCLVLFFFLLFFLLSSGTSLAAGVISSAFSAGAAADASGTSGASDSAG